MKGRDALKTNKNTTEEYQKKRTDHFFIIIIIIIIICCKIRKGILLRSLFLFYG